MVQMVPQVSMDSLENLVQLVLLAYQDETELKVYQDHPVHPEQEV